MKKIDYNNLFFEIQDKSVVKDVDFLKEIGTLYDLLIYLLDNSMKTLSSIQTQSDFLKAITVLRIIISNMKTDITDQSEEQKMKIFAKQENVLSNAEMLLIKRGELIHQFARNNIISKNEKFYNIPKKIAVRTSEKSFLEPIEVSEDMLNSIKLKIFRNKKLTPTIDKKQYTMSDINDLVTKIEEKSISRNEAINIYNVIAKKGKKIAGERQTKNRQTFLDIINSLKKFFDEEPDRNMFDLETEKSAAERRNKIGLGLKILTPNQMFSRLPISLAQLKTGPGLKRDALKALYTSLVKEQELKKQYCSENNTEKLLKDLKSLADTSD